VTDGRLEKFLSKVGDVRGREARAALTLSGYFFLITFTFYIIKPVKESFLIGAKPSWWGFADLATALLIGFVVALNTRFLSRLPRRTYLTASLLFFIACLPAFWYVFNVFRTGQVQSPTIDTSGIVFFIWAQSIIVRHGLIAVLVFSFWADVFIAMTITQFWIAVNDVFDPHQAKRLVGLFVTGGLFGGIAGSALAALMTFARVIKAEDLLLVCPLLLILALVTVNVVYAEQRKVDAAAGEGRIGKSARVGYLESFRTVRRNRYLLLLAAMLASAGVASSLINYQFKQVIKSIFETDQARTSFIAVFWVVILIVSTAFHLITTGRVLRSFGLRWAVLIAPACLLIGSASAFLIPATLMLAWAWAVRGGDKAFDNTLSQSVRELLYIPVPADIKYKAKIFIDMFINKFATGFGAGLFLVLRSVRKFDYRVDQPLVLIREMGVPVIVFLLLSIVLARLVYAEYPAVLKKDIRRRWKEGHRAVAEHVDVDLTFKIFNTIQSRERSTTLYYMNVFDLVRGNSLTPDLKELLGIKRDELKARAMDSLLDVGGEVFFPGLEEAIADAEFQSEIDLVFLLPSYQEIMDKRLSEIAGSPSEVDRIEAASSIRRMVPNPSTLAVLGRLLGDPSSEVVLYALGSAAVHRRPEHVPLILRQLANPMTYAEAQAALAAYGPGIEDLVGPALRAGDEPLEVRRAIPEVLARVGTQRAADILLEELGRHAEDMEPPLVAALFKIRADRPGVTFRDKAVRPEVLYLIKKACDVALNPPGAEDEAKADLDLRIKRVFDLMTLIHLPEDIVNAYQNILQGTARSADYSLEHLDNLLDRELKGLLFPLIEDIPPDERAQRLKKAMRLK
jgi:AAA family ATP:ADP antiporter